MKVGGLKKYLVGRHTDRLFITRPAMITDPDGSSRLVMPTTPTYSDIPCKISFGSGADRSNSQTDTVNPIYEQIKIFCDPGTDVKKGDKLTVHKIDEDGNIIEIYEGMTTNKPSTYNLNKEILFTQLGDA